MLHAQCRRAAGLLGKQLTRASAACCSVRTWERWQALSLLLLRPAPPRPQADEAKVSKAGRMGWQERLDRTAALWPYMVPLMVVYFAEYAMQSGAWTAIGETVCTRPRDV